MDSPDVDNFSHPRGSSSLFWNRSWSAIYQHFSMFQNFRCEYFKWDWLFITFPFDFHHGTHGTSMVSTRLSRIRDNWNEPSLNTTKRIVDQFQFFHLFQMMEHFWKSNEIYIFQNCSYYAIHDFHSLTQKHLCHLVFHLWPIEKDLTGMLPHLWPLSTLFSPHHKLLSAILWEFYHPDFEKLTVSIER